jgi:hypothetical protein
LPCDDDRPTTLYFRVSIHQSILDPTLLVVMVSIVLFRPDFFGFDGDLQARTGCATWDGTCDTIDLDVDLDEVCIEGTETPACVLPDTVTVTVL